MSLQDKYKRALSKRGGFSIVPSALLIGEPILQDKEPMQFRHRMLLLALLALDFHGGWFKAGRRVLKRSGLGNESIALATQELVAAGLLKVSTRPNCLTEFNLDGFYKQVIIGDTSPEEPLQDTSPEEPPKYQLSPDLAEAIKDFEKK